MNEINSLTNSKNITKKNLIMKKVKNLKQNFKDEHKNKYNIFHSKSGKTTKVSPINFHNKIIGYANNKTNLNIPGMLSKFKVKDNKNSRSKSNPKSKSKKSKEQGRNIKQNETKFNKININKKFNFQNMISYIRNKKSISKTQNNSNNQTKINNKSKKKKRIKYYKEIY